MSILAITLLILALMLWAMLSGTDDDLGDPTEDKDRQLAEGCQLIKLSEERSALLKDRAKIETALRALLKEDMERWNAREAEFELMGKRIGESLRNKKTRQDSLADLSKQRQKAKLIAERKKILDSI